MARQVRRSRGRIFLSWQTYDSGDLVASEEVEIGGNFSRRGLVEIRVRGYAKVDDPYICGDPDDCMWPLSILTTLYELSYEYKVLKYRGAESVELAIKLLERGLGRILLYNADVNEVEALLKKEGEVLNLCRNAYEVLQIEKVPGKYLIDC